MAENEHTPPEVLARLAGDKDMRVRSAVVGNDHTPVETITRFAADEGEDSGIRRIAREILDRLSKGFLR